MIRRTLIIVGLVITLLFALNPLRIQIESNLFGLLSADRFSLSLPFIDALERQAYDMRVRWSAKKERDTRVVIIDIDDRSLQTEAKWPWPRALFAKLVDQLYDEYQIDTLGFDVTFPEPENRYTDQKITALADPAIDSVTLLTRLREESGDIQFARSFANRTVVLGAAFQSPSRLQNLNPSFGQLPEPVFKNSSLDYGRIVAETDAPEALRYTSNLKSLAQAATATGFFSISQKVGDPDGRIRRVELLNKFEGNLYPSLSLQLVQSYFGDQAEPLLLDEPDDGYFGLEAIRMMLGDIPLDEQAAVYVPYSTPDLTYEYIPATDILSGTYSGNIAGAIALVGTSAAGLVDLRNTPVGAALPGVEVHANVISAILDEDFRKKPSWITAADFLALILIGLLLSFLLPRLSALVSTLLVASMFAVTLVVNFYFWNHEYLILSLAPILLLIASIYVLNMVVGFFSESAARRNTQKMFGLYVPPEVVEEMSENADIFSLKSEKREMTVLFCDIRDFTTHSESMDPEQLSEWLNDFLTPMTRIIHDHGGAIDKYMGDAIMAFWGAPIMDENHAENGVKAGLEMIRYLDTLNELNRRTGRPEINIGIGLNTGAMSVGNMGSEFRMAYTVVGDAVNLGSRLEGLTKEYGVSVIVSEFTRAAASAFQYEELDRVKVKGKNDAVTIYNCPVDQ